METQVATPPSRPKPLPPKARTLPSDIPLGRVLGLDVTLDMSWLLIFSLITFSLYASLGQDYPGLNPALYWAGALVASILFFSSILTHEISHSLVARTFGLGVHGITLFFFGGVSRLKEEPKRPRDEFFMAAAGPATSAALGLLFIGIQRLLPAGSLPAGVASWLGVVNLGLAVFNLLPGFPLDGGRVFRAIAWSWTKSLNKATRLAARSGSLIAYGMILWGIVMAFLHHNLMHGLWFGFLGWFLLSAAQKSVAQLELTQALGRLQVGDLLRTDCARVGPDERVDRFVEERVLRTGERCYLVSEDDGTLLGLVTLHELKALPRESWATTLIRDVMVPRERLRYTTPGAPLLEALEAMNESGVNQLPVVDGTVLRGMVTREDLLGRLSVQLELGPRPEA